MEYLARLKSLGFEKERGAVALLPLSLFGLQYLFLAFMGPPGWGPAFFALALCYLAAFFGVASQWFWARWFASGLGWSGAMVGIVGLATIGWHPILAIFATLHGLVIGALFGAKMAARYEMQEAWRKRFGMDEHGVSRLGKAVTRASASLPTLILWALAPKEGQGVAAVAAVAAGAGVVGLWGLLRLRTWGVCALAASAGAAILLAAFGTAPDWQAASSMPVAPVFGAASWGAAALAALALTPLLGPIAKALRGGTR
jgi:hypothetical protein